MPLLIPASFRGRYLKISPCFSTRRVWKWWKSLNPSCQVFEYRQCFVLSAQNKDSFLFTTLAVTFLFLPCVQAAGTFPPFSCQKCHRSASSLKLPYFALCAMTISPMAAGSLLLVEPKARFTVRLLSIVPLLKSFD